MRSEGCRLSRSLVAVAPTAVSRLLLERPGCSKTSFENSSAGREAAAHCQNNANCSVKMKWGTPKTPAPSGPLTLYVGPSRDAGRLRARQDRHRAAAPALSERRRTFQTDSLSRPGPRLRGSGRVALSRPPVDRSAGERPTILGSLQMCCIPVTSRRCRAIAGDQLSPYSKLPPSCLEAALRPVRLPRRPASSLAEFFSLARPPSGPPCPSSSPGCCRQPPRPKRPPSDT